MDLSTTTIPDSTQINAEDFPVGGRTVTITGVRPGTSEQPVNIELAEYPDRVYRPGKSMRRVLIAAWGPDSDAYIGKKMTLYTDPTIRFGKDEVGGLRISAMSGIDRTLKIALTVTRGSRKPFIVEPLKDAPTAPAAITPAQEKQITELLAQSDLGDKVAILAFVVEKVGRPVTSSRDLSRDEAATVIAALTERQATS